MESALLHVPPGKGFDDLGVGSGFTNSLPQRNHLEEASRDHRQMQRMPFGVLATLLALQGCTSLSSSDSTVTESFSGTLQLQSSVWHRFTVSEAGTVRVTLTSLATSAANVGLGIGKYTNGCDRLTWSEAATTGNGLAVQADAGEYCAIVSDNGSLTDSATYTVSVTHP